MYDGGFDVMLYVRDLARSVHFYRDVLAFEVAGFWCDDTHRFVQTLEEAPGSHFAGMRAGDTEFKLHATDEDRPGGGAIYHLGVSDVTALHARLREHGVEATEPREMPWGWRMSFATDPDGHILGFFEVLS